MDNNVHCRHSRTSRDVLVVRIFLLYVIDMIACQSTVFVFFSFIYMENITE
ncbi:hypothetical protein BDA96_09G089800 [Sorghum bicolor]|uniref:Uncharacterized protein n=1 Tax=Sorghum bicolor TaxID=4558 RepID=A0A921Q9H7_SORBI|nr:hypothetical protein BDA96_09G089800 [Sorghum bicolor]